MCSYKRFEIQYSMQETQRLEKKIYFKERESRLK